MSQENVKVVEQAIAALNERDIDGYLGCCTEDIELRTPLADIEGAYQGRDGIRRWFADIEAAAPDFRIDLEQVEGIGADRVIAYLRMSATGRSSGVALGTPTTGIYELTDGKIGRIRIFLDRQEALEAAGLSE
jgi:ketosteroid isomerase-like protein